MAAAWQPSSEGLAQLLNLFKASARADNAQHRAIQQQLRDFNAIPDYNNYLVFILNMKQEEGQVRQLAGLVLKNNVKEHWASVSPQVREYVQAALLQSIDDPESYIRATVSSCISTITYIAGLEGWPALLPTLYQMLDSPNVNAVDGAFATLSKICEDSCEKLAADANQQPLHLLIPKFISFFSSPHEQLRYYAVGCVNHFILLYVEPLKQERGNMDAYLQALFGLANDPSSNVRKSLCQAVVMLLEVALDKLLPHMRDVVQYMLRATADEDEYVALEACEFWSSICETKVAVEVLADALPQLVPVLLKGMVYSEEDLLTLDAEDEEDEHVADRRAAGEKDGVA
ncbi:hypothetical protein AB1Y20_012544 [Prymnesium parvum]|uniref:Importin N-terminal domain-containing protein n=1 Tax=Prymnesium parvum TaxID=97485 RepID=A0AB34IKZ2_PRYPA